MAAPPAQVFSIPAGVAFVDALARGLLRRAGGDPLALAAMTVLLPTRRAVRALGEAFLRQGGGHALLLPRLLPLGDVDADELSLTADELLLDPEAALALQAALPPLKRQALLSHLVAGWARASHVPLSGAGVAELARELADLLDEAETNEVSLTGLAELVPERYAAHWQGTLDFLALIAEHWPRIEADQSALSPATRRRRLLELQAETWRRTPPLGPVIAAGSTGSIPAVARLMATVARLPQGLVVLPGFDTDARGPLWEAIVEDPAHPQHGMAKLLETLEITPDAVQPWPDAPEPAPRVALVQAALRPAAVTDSWRDLARGPGDWQGALGGLTWIDCPGPREEATVIALKLREALETPGRTAALVTPDRALARRVRAELLRWDLAIDDSAGTPLEQTPPVVLLRLLAEAAHEHLAPVALLALLKHPLASGGEPPAVFRARARQLERLALRGPRPAPGIGGLQSAILGQLEEASADEKRALTELTLWIEQLQTLLRPYLEALQPVDASPADLLQAHLAAAEALAATDSEDGATRLWRGEAGEAAAELFAAVVEAGDFPPIRPEDWPAWLEVLLRGEAVRPRWGSHPRLAIWGPLEARLQQADLTILGGLNEGTWPAESDPGAWLSRPMRTALGLPSPERRVGLAAHDVAQALAAPEVILTRALKADGAPTLPSRWLLRLEALAKTLGVEASLVRWSSDHLGWTVALDKPAETIPARPPAPRPALHLRPRKLSVTRIETWMRNPYAIYAGEILRLRALSPLDEDPSAAERGILVHRVLERFVARFPERLPRDAGEILNAILEEELASAAVRPGLALLWRPRLRRIADWVLDVERERRPGLLSAQAERKGRLEFDRDAGPPFRLTAVADRIEFGQDGTVVLIDHKTGTPPSLEEVTSGRSPQLSLEAAILENGGFEGVPRASVTALEFWHLTGGVKAGSVKRLKTPTPELIADAYQGLSDLIASFDDPATPYHAWPDVAFRPRFDDYALLARVPEWAPGEEET